MSDTAATKEANATPAVTDPTTTPGGKKLTNKELKELKKQEEAAKRSAKKQASGISVEQQQAQAQAKRDKKQHQREKQQQELKKKETQQQKLLNNKNVKKTSLFSHLETTEERRATLLAIGSALNSPRAARITASGLMVPVVASALSGAKVYTTSNLAHNVAQTTAITSTPTETGSENNTVDLAKSLASLSLENNDVNVVPGVSSIIPDALKKSLDSPELVSNIKELLVNKDFIHPVISQLTFNLAIYKIVGSIPRCIAMLEAFQIVIKDYKTPKGTTLSRNLTNYLSHQIDLLKRARPLSVTMGNAIRWLKQEISHIDPSTADNEAKLDLVEKIGLFAKEKIELADQLIIKNASNQIEDKSTIVTFGSSKVLTELILHNTRVLKKDLEVIVVDSRPLFEGKKMATILRENGVKVIYTLITSLDTVFNMGVDYVFLGAHSILSNGFLYSRAGTAMIAMSAKRRNIPVLVCCESLKFSQRVQLDSVTYNELADPNDLVPIDYESPMERRSSKGILLKQFVKERHEHNIKLEKENAPKGNKQQQQQQQKNKHNKDSQGKSEDSTAKDTDNEQSENVLDDWQKLASLNIVNILYDLTPPEYINKVITEFGALPPSSVPVILREYKGSA
ncbi:Translation initiation factor eIF-2B subunit delta [Maudiozyma exigua]|uniref:Translation initiation factor eIF2B subunit delta n=1 Tax=Maudiozyma exigua TaxID=34358 RepID=A0A9P6WA21_MAUEX|nr:Translation initiation factor eIF-2B subunit delta [Kazachstania exigua]